LVVDEATLREAVTPVDGVLQYTEGPFIGYRGHHSRCAPAPAFWFGHGLGYATWQYGAVELSADGPPPTVSVSITNTGARESREVVQVYYEPAQAEQPIRLVGWQAASVAPGESTEVQVATDPRLWRRWNTSANTWDSLGGGGRLVIARGLGDVRATLDLSP
jgi:beta-glucosidase